MNKNQYLKDAIFMEIVKDEIEYCFNRNYCDDVRWAVEHENITRTQAFFDAIAWAANASIDEIIRAFGDKYNYVIEEITGEKL